MHAANKNQVVLCAIAAVLLLCSLPTTWATINNAQLNFNGGPFGDGGFQMTMPTPAMSIDVTGLNGYVTLGVKIPIWLLAVAGAGALALAALNAAQVTKVPPVALLVALGVVGLFFAVGLVAMLGGNATLGIGYVLAFAGLGLGAWQIIAQMGGNTVGTQRMSSV